MIKLKRFACMLLVMVMVVAMTITSFGQDFSIESLYENLEVMDLTEKLGETVILMLDSPKAYVDLYEVDIDYKNNNVRPLLKDNKTLVPVRFISESLYADVDWNGETSTVTITLGDRTAKLVVGSKEMTINGTTTSIEVPAQLIQNNTFVPLRAIAEALGKEVFYDRGLIIISDTKNILNPATEKGYIDGIISLFQEKAPDGYDYDYYYTMGLLLSYADLDKEAIKYADKLIEIRPNSVHYYTKLEHAYEYKAQLLRYIGEHEEAITYYDKAIALDSYNSSFYFLKGDTLYSLERYEEAIEMFEKSIDLSSGWNSAYYGKIFSLIELGKKEEVIEAYYDLIDLNINNATWVYQCTGELWALGLEKEAIELFDSALKENKDNIEFHTYKGIIWFNVGEYKKAVQVFDEVLSKDKDNLNANLYKYLSLWELGKYQDAVVVLEKLTKIMPEYARQYYDEAKMMYLEGNYVGALNIYNVSIELDPNYAPAYGEKAKILWEMGMLDESIEANMKAIELEPDNPYFYNNTAWVMMENGQYEEALKYVNIGIKLFGDEIDISIIDTRGWILYKLGRYNEAIKDFETVIKGNPSMSSSLYGMACIYAEQNQNQKAIEYLAKAFKADSSYVGLAIKEDVFKEVRDTAEFKNLIDKYNNKEKDNNYGHLAFSN